MGNKILKFEPKLVSLILSGEKTVTWRLFDDKDLQIGDKPELVNSETNEIFAKAEIIGIREKKMEEIDDSDYNGHEKFKDEKKMLRVYQSYYGEKVNLEQIVKIIKFRIIQK